MLDLRVPPSLLQRGAALVVALAAACGGDPPALVINLAVDERRDQDLDTDEVASLLVRIADDEDAVLAIRKPKQEIVLETVPSGEREDIVVFACNGPATCTAPAADFIGCTTALLAPQETALSVLVLLFKIDDPEDACARFVAPAG